MVTANGANGERPSRREFLTVVGGGAATLVVGCTWGKDGPAVPRSDGGTGGSSAQGTGGSSAQGAGGSSAQGAGGSSAQTTDGQVALPDARVLDAHATPEGGGMTDSPGVCTPTTADIEGPFYLPGIPVRSELDLYGDTGDRLTLSGTVQDAACRPIARAVVEIWHADGAAAYDTTSPEKRYYGQVATGQDGSYSFHSLMPAPYLNGSQYRPKHVHMKIWLPEMSYSGPVLRQVLTTQIYFEGDPFIAQDPWASEAPDRIIPLTERAAGDLVGRFDVRGAAFG